jgi:hypothetical protein
MKKLILTYVCLFLVLTPLIYTQVSILGPPVLAGKMKNYETPSQGKKLLIYRN